MTSARIGEEERAEAYLDGELTRDESAAFEQDLADRSETAAALGLAILLRDLLGRLPPLQPPVGLEERIVAALPLVRRAERVDARAAGEARSPSTSSIRAALTGASWLFRPSAAAMQGGIDGARPIAAGLGQVRWLLGPLAVRRLEPEAAPRPVWRRVLGRLGTRGGRG